MSFIAVTALAASMTSVPVCSWNEPGHNRYSGSIEAAVDRYTDIPAPVRDRLKQRMASHRYDEMATIRRDTITGQAVYAPDIRNMHFGAGQVCGTVDRKRWRDDHVERGLVYCEGEHCLIVPTVCRNVSRITRLAPADPHGAAPAQKQAAAPGGSPSAPEGELLFEAPGAGPAATSAGGDAGAGRAVQLGDAGARAPSFQDIASGSALGAPMFSAQPSNTAGLGNEAPSNVSPAPSGGAEFGSLPQAGDLGGPGGTELPASPPEFGIPTQPESNPALPPVTPLSPVPEPASGVMALLGLAGLGAWRRWRGK